MRAKIHKFALAGKLHSIQPRQKTNTNRELFVKLTAMLRGGELEIFRTPMVSTLAVTPKTQKAALLS